MKTRPQPAPISFLSLLILHIHDYLPVQRLPFLSALCCHYHSFHVASRPIHSFTGACSSPQVLVTRSRLCSIPLQSSTNQRLSSSFYIPSYTSNMKTQSVLLAALASVPAALAHTTFTQLYVDGTPQVCCPNTCILHLLTFTRVKVLLSA
jgi:hypothetical protein